eukprot:1717324-Rhodomonas_salina.2
MREKNVNTRERWERAWTCHVGAASAGGDTRHAFCPAGVRPCPAHKTHHRLRLDQESREPVGIDARKRDREVREDAFAGHDDGLRLEVRDFHQDRGRDKGRDARVDLHLDLDLVAGRDEGGLRDGFNERRGWDGVGADREVEAHLAGVVEHEVFVGELVVDRVPKVDRRPVELVLDRRCLTLELHLVLRPALDLADSRRAVLVVGVAVEHKLDVLRLPRLEVAPDREDVEHRVDRVRWIHARGGDRRPRRARALLGVG